MLFGGDYMTYKELLEYIENNPGCLQSREQQKIDFENRFRQWSENQNNKVKSYVNTNKEIR